MMTITAHINQIIFNVPSYFGPYQQNKTNTFILKEPMICLSSKKWKYVLFFLDLKLNVKIYFVSVYPVNSYLYTEFEFATRYRGRWQGIVNVFFPFQHALYFY